jgi:formate--tetrahydrofolate ligase
MCALLKDAIAPNLVQTLEHTPVFVHGGPFANIAHGCNSIRATRMAMKLGEIAITEAGFGADLGAEKFFDIKCRQGRLRPDAVVLVATIRALKYNGGVEKARLQTEDLAALHRGLANLEKHIENLASYGVPVVVALNQFESDTQAEYDVVRTFCEQRDCAFALSDVWAKGGEGGVELAKKVLDVLAQGKANFQLLYDDASTLEDKISCIATKIYGAKNVQFEAKARKQLEKIASIGYGNLPICVAKTPYSFSDDPSKLGRPSDFTLHVREAYVSAGAGFVVVLTGAVMTMPGLPKHPAAHRVDVDANGKITGLF